LGILLYKVSIIQKKQAKYYLNNGMKTTVASLKGKNKKNGRQENKYTYRKSFNDALDVNKRVKIRIYKDEKEYSPRL
jgi:hypothetical protein